nr:methyltransferase domain-containing protein [Candidatus Freyarchaeota archaeon]
MVNNDRNDRVDIISSELEKYSSADVDERGEVSSYEESILQVIRKGELEIILDFLYSGQPRLILDYGCGAGWLSRILSQKGFTVVGVDLNPMLITHAKRITPSAEFAICDCENLPFKNECIDHVFAVAILHHLNLKKSCKEIRRVSNKNTKFLFIEPNLINPISAFGRRFFPMKTHTKGEHAFIPSSLKKTLKKFGFVIEKDNYQFFAALALGHLFKIANIKLPSILIRLIQLFENFTENAPLIKKLNSTVLLIGKVSK